MKRAWGRYVALWRDVGALARPYWTGDDRWPARALLAAIIALNLGLVGLNVLFSGWNNRFYDALQHHDLRAFWHEFAVFGGLAAAFIVVAVYQTYLNQMLQIRWRRWLTDHALSGWLRGGGYYHLQRGHAAGAGHDADNPDQRIADDLQLFVDATLNLGLGLLSSVVTLLSFANILWKLSGELDFPVGALHVAVPGYMLWAALAYAVGGTWIAHRIGRPLVALNFNQQRVEADFRFALVRLRENAEGVALLRGEPEEARGLSERFAAIVGNWWSIMRQRKRLTWFTAGYDQVAIVFPILAAAPRYFAGALELGGLMQTAQAFGQVQGALSWFVGAYASLAQWKATVDRLSQFRRTLDAVAARVERTAIARIERDDGRLVLRDVALDRPDGSALLRGIDLRVEPGQALLVTGPSGSGKSTLLRAIAGLWPFGRGTIELPARTTSMFLPQKPYLPLGSLRRALCYPAPERSFDAAAIGAALRECELEHLEDCLDEVADWSQRLSPGEQQRLAFARAWLLRPACLYLDEATAALDEAAEGRVYRRLRARLPDATIVSVGHRGTLAALHDRRLEVVAPKAPSATAARLNASTVQS